MKRRTFLQQAGLTLLALGASETALSLLGRKSFASPLVESYYQVAQPSARKLALLVGINQYPRGVETRIASLQGCVTDVELQRELLIHRFGFNPSDILTLTDSQATRENIETAFLEHLTQQAAEGDVVVFHFSGYGSCLTANEEQDSSIQNQTSKIKNSLMPVDGVLSAKEGGFANYLPEETLLLLLRSLLSDNVTTILDTSYKLDANTVLQGNLRVRSFPPSFQQQLSAAELAFQERLLLKVNAKREQLASQRSSQLPGIVLAAAGPSQPATEAPWGSFSAGLFTYALTQYLWQAMPPTTVLVSLSRAAGIVEQLVGDRQQPTLSGQKSREESLLAYNLTPDPKTCADGVVMAVEDNGKTAHLWLAGLPATVLEYYGVNSLLTLISQDEVKVDNDSKLQTSTQDTAKPTDGLIPKLQIRSKDGLSAKARIVGIDNSENYNLQMGQLVREAVRMLPRNVSLTVALDARLERIERVDATSAFANVDSVSSIVAAGEQPADYLFGREPIITELPTEEIKVVESSEQSDISKSNTPLKGGSQNPKSYGLFSIGLDSIPNTTGQAGEAVKVAVNRLQPKLKTLLAAKLWRLSVNEGSSLLGIRATLEMVAPTQQVLMQRETMRKQYPAIAEALPTQSLIGIPTIANGSRIQYRIQNESNQPVYLVMLGIDSNGNAIAFFPPQSSQTSNAGEVKMGFINTVIPVATTLTIPNPAMSFEWFVQGSPGIAQFQLICSRAPFTQTLTALAAANHSKGEQERVGELFNPLDVARTVLQDLHEASAVPAKEINGTSTDIYALDVNAWASFNFIYQVV